MDSKTSEEIRSYLLAKGIDAPSDNDVSRAYDEYMKSLIVLDYPIMDAPGIVLSEPPIPAPPKTKKSK